MQAAHERRSELRGSRHFLRLLVLFLVAELLMALFSRTYAIYELFLGEGRANVRNVTGAIGLLMIPAILWALVGTYRVQRRLGQSLSIAREELSSAMEVTREWVWNVDQTGRITYSNATVERILGYGADEVVGRDSLELMHPDDAANVVQLLPGFISRKEGWSDFTLRWRHKDGTFRFLESSAVPILDENDELRGWRGSDRDVTPELREIEDLRGKRDRIQQVIDQQDLRVMFQPIVNLETGRMVGAEALARFTIEPLHGPAVWFAEARETGLGPDLEVLAIKLAIREAPKLPEDVYLSVNVSPDTLLHPSFSSLLLEAGFPLERVVVEITEHDTIHDYERAREIIRWAQRLGVRVAVDDAGAGYASFQHILRLDPDYVKLDRNLTTMIHEDPARRALAAAMVSFADSIGAQVIAEGMESLEQVATLHQKGVFCGQGYYFMHPSPAAELRKDYGLEKWADLPAE